VKPETLNLVDQKLSDLSSAGSRLADLNSISLDSKNVISTRHIPREIKRRIWQKYNSQCAYINPKTGQKCSSRYFLEIEHVQPTAKGGSSHEENLKLYCRAHNQFSAIQQFGFAHMDKFIN
jgi:5-methylcytosine-specific restriction endonuclease McrA